MIGLGTWTVWTFPCYFHVCAAAKSARVINKYILSHITGLIAPKQLSQLHQKFVSSSSINGDASLQEIILLCRVAQCEGEGFHTYKTAVILMLNEPPTCLHPGNRQHQFQGNGNSYQRAACAASCAATNEEP